MVVLANPRFHGFTLFQKPGRHKNSGNGDIFTGKYFRTNCSVRPPEVRFFKDALGIKKAPPGCVLMFQLVYSPMTQDPPSP